MIRSVITSFLLYVSFVVSLMRARPYDFVGTVLQDFADGDSLSSLTYSLSFFLLFLTIFAILYLISIPIYSETMKRDRSNPISYVVLLLIFPFNLMILTTAILTPLSQLFFLNREIFEAPADILVTDLLFGSTGTLLMSIMNALTNFWFPIGSKPALFSLWGL